jgi:two-component system, chemotaxis family, chemotaxis protein CheY
MSLRVLIADDMNTMRKLVARALKEMGITDIAEFPDGALAWQALSTSEKPFDLVISDWNMPNATGLDFLKRVRADGRLKKLPFILLTAESEQSQVQEALKAGVSGYIIKPFTAAGLREKIESTFAKAAGK